MYATLKTTADFAIEQGKPDLKALQGAVGGYIELIRLEQFGMDMWLNEEGKLTGLEPNPIATEIGHACSAIFDEDWIAGNVAFTGGSDDEGNTLSLNDEQVRRLRKMIDMASKVALGRMLVTGQIVVVSVEDPR